MCSIVSWKKLISLPWQLFEQPSKMLVFEDIQPTLAREQGGKYLPESETLSLYIKVKAGIHGFGA